MLNKISISHVFVLDQDEAVDFYVGKLGLEISNDMDLGFMRWLTVSVPGDPGREILLEKPGPPAMDEATAAQVRELVAKGSDGLRGGLHDQRLPEDLRDLEGTRRRVHTGADRAVLRDRHRAARPLRQPHPDRAAGGTAQGGPDPRDGGLSGRRRPRPPEQALTLARRAWR